MSLITPGLGGQMRALRRDRDWTLRQVAEALGFNSWSTVSQWECGWNDPDQQTLDRFNQLFGSNLVLTPSVPSTKRKTAATRRRGTNDQTPAPTVCVKLSFMMDDGPKELDARLTPDALRRIINIAVGL